MIRVEIKRLEKEAEEINNLRKEMMADVESEKDPATKISKMMAAGICMAMMIERVKRNTARFNELTEEFKRIKAEEEKSSEAEAEETVKAYLKEQGLMPKED